MSTADRRKPRRPGRTTLLAAWLAALLAAAGLAAFALLAGPDRQPVDGRELARMGVPEPPQQTADTGPDTGEGTGSGKLSGADTETETEADAAETGPSGPPPASETAGAPADPAPKAEADAPSAAGESAPAPDRTTAPEPAPADTAGRQGPPPPPPLQSDPDAPIDLLSGAAPERSGADQRSDADTAQTARAPADGGSGGQADRAGETDAAGPLPQLPLADPQAPAWQRYARRLTPPPDMPKIAVVVRGLGLSSAAAEAAVTRLPPSVSLSFTPYARDRTGTWAGRARRQGHEVLLDLPMEPRDYPARDPGPKALRVELPPAANLERLDWILAQAEREVGVVAEMGSAFLTAPKAVEPVIRELDRRGLMYLDNGVAADNAALRLGRQLGLPYAVNDRTLDAGQVSRRAIESRLVEAERLAREQGLAVVIAHPYPVSLDLLADWTGKLEQRGFVLVPATFAAIQRSGRNSAQLR